MLCGQQNKDETNAWVMSKLNSMTLEEKIGQLFMIRAHSDLGADHIKSVESQIKKYKVGGLCFFQGTPQKQAELTNKYQALSETPLMVAIDAETGLGMRHKAAAITFPDQLTLGAIRDNTSIYQMGRIIAEHLNRIGVHVNFAPVVDVNNNPANPVIHNRSFGEDIFNVATKSFAYMKGLQDGGIIACAKHFPGHGDTDVDSHYDLPLISHDRERIDSIELLPFRVLTQLGVKSMMTAHLAIPVLDARPNRPTSLSQDVVQKLLQDEMHFEGLIFTDGLEMHGVAKHFKPGIMEVEALIAGNDIMLLPIDIDAAFQAIKEAIKNGQLTKEQLDVKVKKILSAKYNSKLNTSPRITSISAIPKDVNKSEHIAFKSKLYQQALTLVKDQEALVPLKNIGKDDVAIISLGETKESDLQKSAKKFARYTCISTSKDISTTQKSDIIKKINKCEIVIIGLYDMSISSKKNFGITKSMFDLIYDINSQKEVILVNYGSPYALKFFEKIPTILQAYEDDPLMQDASLQAIMGVNPINGELPVSVDSIFSIKSGLHRNGYFRLGYADPEMLFVDKDTLKKIDTIVSEMIQRKAAPGCQVLAIKDGKIFFEKSYGYHTYDKKRKSQLSDIYDVASVTKTLATTISLMKLYDEGKLDLYKPLKKYLPHLDTTNKGPLIVEDMLAHHSGLPGWIPFYEDTMEEESKRPKRIPSYFSDTRKPTHTLRINDELWIRNDWQDSIYNMVYNCDLRDRRNYRYSDLSFYLFKQLIERQTGDAYKDYVSKEFYEPLNLNYTLFNPLNKFSKERIPPTEKDDYFRLGEVHGYVHDMGAAMLGGVSGHAGLFSNGKDLAVLMQMLLNGGQYEGKKYLTPKTIQKFTTRYFRSTRRGLGFDMKELDPDRSLNVAEECSTLTFGHLGFTGISVFADPKYDFIFIFLSNRTYPSMDNNKFSKYNYRPRIQSVFYRAMTHNNNPALN